jgi:microsomal dipeptidase-like Zn-dependent dipeptidase
VLDIILTVGLQSVILVVLGFFAYRFLARQINDTISAIVENFFSEPLVKQSMSVLGKKSGEVRAEKATVDKMAKQVLNSPNLAGYKMLGKQLLGIDVDEMIDEEGAMNTIAGLRTLAQALGIDITQMIGQGLQGNMIQPAQTQTTTTYLKG